MQQMTKIICPRFGVIAHHQGQWFVMRSHGWETFNFNILQCYGN